MGGGRGCISGDMTDKPSNMVLTLGSKTSDKEFIPHYIASRVTASASMLTGESYNRAVT